jgi:hypothetical protein
MLTTAGETRRIIGAREGIGTTLRAPLSTAGDAGTACAGAGAACDRPTRPQSAATTVGRVKVMLHILERLSGIPL